MLGKLVLIMIGVLLQSAAFCDSFITKDEYAQMLYKNPRGIGCDKCHGANGEGLVLSSYVNEAGEHIAIKAPRIDNISMKQFYKSFDTKSKLMPVYFLTDNEKAYLFYYLTKNKTKERTEHVD